MSKICTKGIDNRLATVEGHLRAVRKMVAEDGECEEVLRQLVAIDRAIKKAGAELLKSHMSHCAKDSLKEGHEEVADRLNKLVGAYLWLD